MNFLKKLFQKKKREPLFHAVKQGNTTMLYDSTMKEYFESTLPNPTQADIVALGQGTLKVTISKRTPEPGTNRLLPVVVKELNDPTQIKELIKNLEIIDAPFGHLMTFGSYLFDFTLDDTGEVQQIEYLEFGAIRWPLNWKDDAQLKDPLALLEYLHALGISEPLEHWHRYEKNMQAAQQRFNTWKDAAPPSLLNYLEESNRNPLGIDGHRIFNDLKKDISNEKELILKLFELYGDQFHAWNGVPTYELLPSYALMAQPFKVLNTAFQEVNLSPEHKEGMARFLASWDFKQTRKTDIQKINEELKLKLLAHLEQQQDEEKIDQFKKLVLNP